MRKYLLKIFVIIPVIIIFAGFNYWVDPENLFQGEKYEKGIADYLLEGKNVTGLYNFDERLLQKYFIGGMQTVPDVVVLGPSRSLLINADVLNIKGQKVINNSISGPTIEDELAIFDMYLRKGWYPKKIIIGVDPYYLNEKKTTRKLYSTIRDYYFDICDSMGVKAHKDHELFFRYRNIEKLFLIQYFQESILFAINTGNNHKYYASNAVLNNTVTKLSDGSISYGKETREHSPDEVANLVKSINTEELANYFQPIDKYDQEYISKFEKFIDFLTSKGIEIDLVMPPFHPLWYAHFKNDGHFKLYLATEDFFINFAHQHNIHFFGSLDPAKCGVSGSDFYDEMHLKAPGMRKVMETER